MTFEFNNLLGCFVCFACWCASVNRPHVFEDGFVEKSLSIVVRDNRAYGEYRLGFNNNTLGEIVKQWHSKSSSNAVLENLSRGSLADSIEKKSGTIESPADSSQPEPDTAKETDTVKSATDVPKRGETKEHWLDPDLMTSFRESITRVTQEELVVHCGEKELVLENVRIGPPVRHPFYIGVTFEFSLPKSGMHELKLRDGVLPKYKGAVRYAIRTQGKAMLLNSNVAANLARAKRLDVRPSEENDSDHHTPEIQCKIGMMPDNSTKINSK